MKLAPALADPIDLFRGQGSQTGTALVSL
jgi:hypothetical protein